jgi:hypothetical protein
MGMSNGVGTLAGMLCPIVTEKITSHGVSSTSSQTACVNFTATTVHISKQQDSVLNRNRVKFISLFFFFYLNSAHVQ